MALVYVMGPSGAGKDSVLLAARKQLSPAERVIIAHRYITRPADGGAENHVALSAGEFESRRAAGLFAFHWQAHGFRYAIGAEIELWQRAGFTVVVSGSREHFTTWQPRPADVVPVMITASSDTLRGRLAARDRENAAAMTERLQRAADYKVDDHRLVLIDNSGALADSVQQLVGVLRRAARVVAPA
jgi:ribose 1,5-bisphosphokinase